MSELNDLMRNFTGAKSKKHTSMKSFNDTLVNLLDRTIESTQKLAPIIAEELFRDIVPATPHLTGRAQANWGIDTKPISTYDPTASQPDGQINLPAIPKNEPVIYVGNKAPYISGLEAGTVSAKGSHMVHDALKRISNKIQRSGR